MAAAPHAGGVERRSGRSGALGALAAPLALVVAVACALPPRPIEYVGEGEGPDTADGLYRVRSIRVAALYLRPGAQFAGYDGLLIDPVSVSFEPPKRVGARMRLRDSFAPESAIQECFERIFQEALAAELGRSRYFRLVSQPGPTVLRVAGRIVDLVIDVPPSRVGEIHTILKAGEMSLVLDVLDSETGASLARVVDRRDIRPSASFEHRYENIPVNNWGAVRDVFAEWARILRGGLDELRFLQYVPVPGESEER